MHWGPGTCDLSCCLAKACQVLLLPLALLLIIPFELFNFCHSGRLADGFLNLCLQAVDALLVAMFTRLHGQTIVQMQKQSCV